MQTDLSDKIFELSGISNLQQIENDYVFTEEEFKIFKSATEALYEISQIPQIAELARHFKSHEPYGPIVEAVKKICEGE